MFIFWFFVVSVAVVAIVLSIEFYQYRMVNVIERTEEDASLETTNL